MAEDKPLPVELPAPALKQAQRRVLWVQAASDRFGYSGAANLGSIRGRDSCELRMRSGSTGNFGWRLRAADFSLRRRRAREGVSIFLYPFLVWEVWVER